MARLSSDSRGLIYLPDLVAMKLLTAAPCHDGIACPLVDLWRGVSFQVARLSSDSRGLIYLPDLVAMKLLTAASCHDGIACPLVDLLPLQSSVLVVLPNQYYSVLFMMMYK